MGTLAAIAPVLGILAGYLIARLTPYELKQGKKYFAALAYALAITVIGLGIWQRINGQQLQLEAPIFLLFIPFSTIFHKNYKALTSAAAGYILIAILSSL